MLWSCRQEAPRCPDSEGTSVRRLHTNTCQHHLLSPWFSEHGVDALVLQRHSGPVLRRSHHRTCIQEPVTVGMTHCGRERDKEVGGWWG